MAKDISGTQSRGDAVSFEILTDRTFERRAEWLNEIVQISGHFGNDSSRIELELDQRITQSGHEVILDHLRLAGAIS